MKRPVSSTSFASSLIALVLAHAMICHALMSAAAPRIGVFDLPLPTAGLDG